MPIKSLIPFAFLLLSALQIPVSSARDRLSTVSPTYRVNVGDELAVSVYAEPELTVTTRVTETGVISYPLLGDVDVRGRTTREIEQRLVAGLKGPYLVDPKVTVSIRAFRPFFVNGEVQKQGPVPFQPGITVREAISLAGGFTERASQRKIFLIPEGRKNKTKGKKVSLDDVVGPGDVLTVEQSFF